MHENEAPTTIAGRKTLARNILNDSNHWLQFQFEPVLVDIDNVSILGVVVSGKFAATNLANTTYQRTYNFKVYVLTQNASKGANFGDYLYKEVELSHDEFLTQRAKTMIMQLNGKLDGKHQQAYLSMSGHPTRRRPTLKLPITPTQPPIHHH